MRVAGYIGKQVIGHRIAMSKANERNLCKLEGILSAWLQDPSDGVRKEGQAALKVYALLYPKSAELITGNNTQ